MRFALPLGLVALLVGCPALFPGVAPNVDSTLRQDSASTDLSGLIEGFGSIGGRWRVKMFDRKRTREFVLDAELAGRHLNGTIAPLNEAAPPRWAFTGLLGDDGTATLSVTLGSTTSAEPATTSLTVLASLRRGDYQFASPAPSPEPSPTPPPTPPRSSGGPIAVPAPSVKSPGGLLTSFALVGTWSEAPATGSTPATGSFTAIRVNKPTN